MYTQKSDTPLQRPRLERRNEELDANDKAFLRDLGVLCGAILGGCQYAAEGVQIMQREIEWTTQ
jgi:hypothetical protein